ncbi:MAG: hypothetical protein WBC44_21065 [Planctomycetaceae bacterium]
MKATAADETEEKKDDADAPKVVAGDPTAKTPDAEKAKDDDQTAVAKTDSKPKEAKPPEAEPATKPASADAAGTIVHDAATLALIDAELKLATPEEKDKLFAEWKSLDSAMVQQVIRIRRMVRELGSSSPSSVAATTPTPATLPGTTSPWGVNANSASPPSTAGDDPAVATASPPSSPASEGIQVAQGELPTIEPAGHSTPRSTLGVESTAAYGRATLLAAADGATAGDPTGARANGLPSAPAAPASAATPSAVDPWSNQVQQMIAAAEARAEKSSTGFLNADPQGPPVDETTRRHYIESQVQLRLLYVMAGDQARAIQAIPGLEPADQQFWQQILWGVSTYFDEAAMPNRADRMTQTVEQLRTAVTRLQGEANLQLRNVAFCRKITSFGNFERFDHDEYSPGQRVLLYAEVLNFKSVPQPSDGLYKTQLKSTVEILRAGQSQPLTKIEFDPTVDLCRSYRQDYFHSYELKIPDELNVGAYVLKLTVEDAQSGKLATYTLNFTVK